MIPRPFVLTSLGLGLLVAGCEMPMPQEPAGMCNAALGTGGQCMPFGAELSACSCGKDDYTPRLNASKNDSWPACITDDNQIHLVGMSLPAAAARTRAFDSMGKKLWANSAVPSATDFTNARMEYAVEEGIASRVQRRQDIHHPEVPGSNKFACSDAGVPAMYPDRCAAPAKLLPILNDAFQKGEAGMEPRVQAARIEAALLWFFYLSVGSEQWTCGFDDKDDCDSQIGYYNAMQARDQIIGLSSYIRPLSQETHDRIFDGMLAARCWRDLDRETPSQCAALYQAASKQTDKPLTRGMALILRERIGKVKTLAGAEQTAAMAFVSTLGPFLDRASRAINPVKADELKAQVAAASPDMLDATKAQAAIDALFPCP